MSPQLRNALIAAVSIPISAWMGWEIAEGAYFWPTLFGVVCCGATIASVAKLGADVVFMGMLVVGYIIGNRGFAQLMPAPGLPILPAEVGILLGCSWMGLKSALRREVPLQRNQLSYAVLAWLAVGTIRVGFDVKSYGLLAVRDYAQVYYALFFFIVYWQARSRDAREYLLRSLLVAAVLLLPVFGLYSLFPEVFLTQFTLLGTPIIFFKGDLVFTFIGVSAFLLFHWAEGIHRRWAWPLATVLFFTMASGDNRASIVGGAFAMTMLLFRRHWKFPAAQASMVVLGLFAVFILSQAGNNWAERKLAAVTDRVTSMVDVSGTATYRSDESGFKGDNNRFRLVWWGTVISETWAGGPVFGLGFGHDLASGFVRAYYPTATDDFTTRSPHNFFVTTFGRMGLTGVLAWILICVALWRLSQQVLRRQEAQCDWGLAVAPWVVLVSSSFGVVLEGPMGAMPFWMMLGLLQAKADALASD